MQNPKQPTFNKNQSISSKFHHPYSHQGLFSSTSSKPPPQKKKRLPFCPSHFFFSAFHFAKVLNPTFGGENYGCYGQHLWLIRAIQSLVFAWKHPGSTPTQRVETPPPGMEIGAHFMEVEGIQVSSISFGC